MREGALKMFLFNVAEIVSKSNDSAKIVSSDCLRNLTIDRIKSEINFRLCTTGCKIKSFRSTGYGKFSTGYQSGYNWLPI